jgi:carbon storage regulator
MLVLSRSTKDTIHVGDDVTIHILSVRGQTVRVGIEAPKSVRVMRGEIANRDRTDHRPDPRDDDPR